MPDKPRVAMQVPKDVVEKLDQHRRALQEVSGRRLGLAAAIAVLLEQEQRAAKGWARLEDRELREFIQENFHWGRPRKNPVRHPGQPRFRSDRKNPLPPPENYDGSRSRRKRGGYPF